MKKTLALIVSLVLLFGSASMAYANDGGQGNLDFTPVGAFYDEDNDLILYGILANIGNKTLENVESFDFEVYDANGVNIANVSLQYDEFLTGLSLAPGETVFWPVAILGPEQGDVSNFSIKYTATFYSVGDATHESGVLIVVNNQPLETEVAPFVENGTTLVPLRPIFESLGADVQWDQKTQTVTATRNEDVIKLTIGDNFMTVNGEKVELAVPAKVVNGYTMVPLRAISESFGGTVAYGKTGNAVTIAIRID